MSDVIDRIAEQLKRTGRPSSDYDLNPDVTLPEGRKLRPAAVLLPIIHDRAEPEMILTMRSSALKHHPGQIAFPGGKVDEADGTHVSAALREAHEEIGLPQSNVAVLGALPAHETVTGFTVMPIVGHVRRAFQVLPEPGEVSEVFRVPLSHVLDPRNYAIQSRRWRGTQRHYYTVPFGPYYIWGATARMLRAFADSAAGR